MLPANEMAEALHCIARGIDTLDRRDAEHDRKDATLQRQMTILREAVGLCAPFSEGGI